MRWNRRMFHTKARRGEAGCAGHIRLVGESEGRALPELPPGIPTGFCHEARGCAAEALPRVKAKDINNPEGVVPMVRMGGM